MKQILRSIISLQKMPVTNHLFEGGVSYGSIVSKWARLLASEPRDLSVSHSMPAFTWRPELRL